jgi:hypothetical protein
MQIRNCTTCQTDNQSGECNKCTGQHWPNWTDGSEERMDVIGQNGNTGEHYAAVAHYKFSFNGVKLDPYRILDVYGIAHPAQQHAIKKLLRAGKSVKTLRQDVEEVQLTLQRWLELMDEA